MHNKYNNHFIIKKNVYILKLQTILKRKKCTHTLINYLIMGALNLRIKYTECAEGSIPFLFLKKDFLHAPFCETKLFSSLSHIYNHIHIIYICKISHLINIHI